MKIYYRLIIYILLITPAKTLVGQGFPSGGAGGSDRIEGKFKFTPLPYVDYDRALGFTVGLIPMAMMNLSEQDTISPSSTVGLIGMYSENKTAFLMGFGMLYLDEDNWRVLAAGGMGDINFQYFAAHPINRWFKYNTAADFAFLEVQRKVRPNLYLGLNYVYTTFKTQSEVFTDSTATALNGLGLSANYDKRSNVSYPRNGYQIEFDYTTYPGFMGNKEESDQITLAYNHYFPFRKNNDVLATRVYTGINVGNVNFNQEFIVGETDIRGYSFGQFRGKSILAIQGEYRWNFTKRMGLVGFAGLATVFGSENEGHNGRLLPGVGTGFRYVFMEDTHSTIGFDIAAGDGDWGFYFRFSEAF